MIQAPAVPATRPCVPAMVIACRQNRAASQLRNDDSHERLRRFECCAVRRDGGVFTHPRPNSDPPSWSTVANPRFPVPPRLLSHVDACEAYGAGLDDANWPRWVDILLGTIGSGDGCGNSD